jgi:hypothetical protein
MNQPIDADLRQAKTSQGPQHWFTLSFQRVRPISATPMGEAEPGFVGPGVNHGAT